GSCGFYIEISDALSKFWIESPMKRSGKPFRKIPGVLSFQGTKGIFQLGTRKLTLPVWQIGSCRRVKKFFPARDSLRPDAPFGFLANPMNVLECPFQHKC